MKKAIFIVLCLVMALFFSSCKSPGPDDMSKWSSGKYEMYVLDDSNGFLIYTNDEEKYVFDISFKYGKSMYIYEHRESDDQIAVLLASYDGLMNFSDKKCSYSLFEMYDISYNHIFEQRITFKKQCENITFDDIPYKFVYGNPLKQNISYLEYSSGVDSFKLHIFESKQGGYIEIVSNDSGDAKFLDVFFESDGKMTVVDHNDNSKRVQYFIYQKCDQYIAESHENTQEIFDIPNQIYWDYK